MIDAGATHNFISIQTVELLKIPVCHDKSFEVSLGTGQEVRGSGECRAIPLVVQGVVITEDYLPLPLSNSDLILGIQWLEKLGTMVTNWRTQTMQFTVGKEKVTLRGEGWGFHQKPDSHNSEKRWGIFGRM